MNATILIVEDDRKTADLIRLYLLKAGFQPMVTHDGRSALELARTHNPALIVLDWMLPQIDGLDVCRNLRHEMGAGGTPIIMLTAKSTEDDKLLGLELGADDYITKPFSPRELIARIRVLLRRTGNGEATEPDEIEIDGLTVNFVQHQVLLHGQSVLLTPKEFQLLAAMIKAPGKAFSRSELMQQAFGYDYEGLDRTVDVHVLNLRKKLEADPAHPRYVQTVYGVGYKLAVATL